MAKYTGTFVEVEEWLNSLTESVRNNKSLLTNERNDALFLLWQAKENLDKAERILENRELAQSG